MIGGAALGVGGAAGCLPGVDGQWPEAGKALCSWSEPSVTPGDPTAARRVVELHDAALSIGARVQQTSATANMRKLLLALTGKADMKGAWGAILPTLQAGQVVGIKVNTLNKRVPTHPEVIRAVVDLLKEGTGLGADRVVVWDRRLDELTSSGITAQTMGAAVEGTWQDADAKGSGRGYELSYTCIGGRNTRLSNIMTRRVDHLINLAVMKRHGLSGYSGVLKNHYGTIDNPGEFHDQLGPTQAVQERRFDLAIPGINALDEVHRKTRLWLLDSVIGVCKGGTESPPDCAPNRLLASLDPVALDARGRAVRDEARGTTGKDPETVSDGWLKLAEKAGLGKVDYKVEKI